MARHLTVHGTMRMEDGTYIWKFDNYVRAFPPYDMRLRDIQLLWSRIACPTLILTGSEDNTHQRALALQGHIPNAELKVLPGAGHACMLEQPWLFDRFMLEFLRRRGLLPAATALAVS